MNRTSLFLPMLSLIFVLALVILGYMAINNKRKKGTENKGVKEYARHYLTPKSYISVTKIGKKFYILGVSEHGINLIDEISNEEVEEHFSINNPMYLVNNFSEFLKKAKIMEKLKNKRDVENEEGN